MCMPFSTVSFQQLLDLLDINLEKNLNNNARKLEYMYNNEKFQEILNRIIQRIKSIISSTLHHSSISYKKQIKV